MEVGEDGICVGRRVSTAAEASDTLADVIWGDMHRARAGQDDGKNDDREQEAASVRCVDEAYQVRCE